MAIIAVTMLMTQAGAGAAWCWGKAGWPASDHRSQTDSASASEPPGSPDTQKIDFKLSLLQS